MHNHDELQRMIDFINYEAKEKINELKIKGIEEYNTEKAKHLHHLQTEMHKLAEIKRNELESKYQTKITMIRNKHKLHYLTEKENVLKILLERVKERLKMSRLNKNLIPEFDNPIFYVNEKDKEFIKKNYPNSIIKKLQDEYIGGVILTNKDKSVVVDNSYLTRLRTLKEKHISIISNMIFNKLDNV